MIVIELLFALLAAFIAFRVFLRLMGGTRINKVIDKVTHPAVLTPDEVIEEAEQSDRRVSLAESATDADIELLTKRQERLRRRTGRDR